MGRAAAWAPPAQAACQRMRAVWPAVPASTLRRSARRRWVYSRRRSSAKALRLTWLSVADAEAAAGLRVVGEGEEAVTQIAFGAGAQAGDGAGGGQALAFVLGGVGAVDQAPGGAHGGVGEEPFGGGGAQGGDAGFDFGALFGDVDVGWGVEIYAGGAADQAGQGGGGDGAQAVWGQAEAQGGGLAGAGFGQEGQGVFRGGVEAALAALQGGAVEAGGFVDAEEEGEADAGLGGALFDGVGHGGAVCVGGAAWGVLQVVELHQGGEAALQAEHGEVGGDRGHGVGFHGVGGAVHGLPPGPEIAAAAGVFGEAGEAALEGVAVQVDHAWEDGAGDVVGGSAGGYAGDLAAFVVDLDVWVEAVFQEGVVGGEGRHGLVV